MKVNQVEGYQIKHARDAQNPRLIFETRTGRIVLRKSPLKDADEKFLGSLSDRKILKNDFIGKF
jgi:signal recognition particle subunit SEC65